MNQIWGWDNVNSIYFPRLLCDFNQRSLGNLTQCPAPRQSSRNVTKTKTFSCARSLLRSRQDTLCCLKTREFWIVGCSGIVGGIMRSLVPPPWGARLPPKAQAAHTQGKSSMFNEIVALLHLILSPACWICTCRSFPFLEHITWKRYFLISVSPAYSTQKLTTQELRGSSTGQSPG